MAARLSSAAATATLAQRLGLSRSQLFIALFLAIVLVMMAFLQNQPEVVEPYDPDDTGSTGLRALVLWLEELGHPVTSAVPRTGLSDENRLLWIHTSSQSSPAYASDVAATADATLTYNWVQRGGTLVLVGPSISYFALSDRFGVEQIETFAGVVSDTHQVQPLLPDVPSKWNSFFAAHSLEFFDATQACVACSGERAIVPVLAHTNGDPVVALQFIGEGVVWHLTEDFALTNLNLRDERVASLLPAILRTVPEGAPVVFSTPHLATFDASDGDLGAVNTLQDWLYTTPFGQGTLLIMGSLFVYLLLQGRRLGPALPGPTANRPREAAEYVTALAGLQQRIRQPHVVADHHRQRLKSAVGRLAQLPADLPDPEWLALLRRAEALSPAQLNEVAELLSGYAKVDVGRRLLAASSETETPANSRPLQGRPAAASSQISDEAELIRLVRATDTLLASLPRANKHLVR